MNTGYRCQKESFQENRLANICRATLFLQIKACKENSFSFDT